MANRSISDIRPPQKAATTKKPASLATPAEPVVQAQTQQVMPTQPVISPEELPAPKASGRKVWGVLGTILVLLLAAGAAVLIFWVITRG